MTARHEDSTKTGTTAPRRASEREIKKTKKNYNRATYLFVIDMDGKKKEAVKPNYVKLLSQVLRHNIVNTILNTP